MDDDSFSRLVGRIYDTVIVPEEYDNVLNGVLQATNSHFMLVTAFHRDQRAAMPPRFIGELTSRRLDGIAEYTAGAAAGDLTLAFVHANPNGGLFETDTVLDREAHAVHPYINWNKHYVGNAHWIAHFQPSGSTLFGASLHPCSGDDPHTASERRRFAALFDHMARAWKLATIPTDLASHHEAIAIVNGAGRPVAMSPRAAALVDSGDGLMTHQGELLPSDRRIWPRWREALQRVAVERWRNDDALLLPRRGQAKPLLAVIGATPLQPGFASYARDVLIRFVDRAAPPADITTISMRLWGLTPAEARLLQVLVANDFALREAADRLGVTYATVRTQLACIFAKTETGGQPGLMRLVTRLSG